MIEYFRVLEVSVIDTYPTNYTVLIKLDFHSFDSSTVICTLVLPPQLIHAITNQVCSCKNL